MKLKIAFGIMCVIALLAIIYGYVQATIAMEARRDALVLKELADKQRTIAEQISAEANKQRMEAERQRVLYMQTLQELEDLKKKKK